MRLVLALLSNGLKNWRCLKPITWHRNRNRVTTFSSTVIYVTFRLCIFLNRKRLPNSKFNIQFTNCPKKRNNTLPCLKYHDLHGKCPFADPCNKDNVSNIWDGYLTLYFPTWLNNTMIVCLVTSRSKFLRSLAKAIAQGTIDKLRTFG